MNNRYSEFSAAELQDINRRTIDILQEQSAAAAAAPSTAVSTAIGASAATPDAGSVAPAAMSTTLQSVVTHVLGRTAAAPMQDAVNAGAHRIAQDSLAHFARFSRDDLRNAFISASEKVK